MVVPVSLSASSLCFITSMDSFVSTYFIELDSVCVMVVAVQVKQLKVSHKENLSVCKTLDALVPMRGCLETSIGAAGTAATASAGETPVQANGLTRLALGSAILQAGEHYECALQLVAAQWAVGAALLDCAEKENSKARSAAESLAKMSSVLAALNGIDANGAKCVEAVAGVLPPAAVIAVEAEVVEMYRRAGEQALDGMERLLEAADAMQLRAVWVDNLAPLSGKELKEIFTSLPASSPIYGEVGLLL